MRNSQQLTDATIRHVWDVAITRLATPNALREGFGCRSPLATRADRYNLNRTPPLTGMICNDALTRRFFTSCREGFSARRFGAVYCWSMLETVALKQPVSPEKATDFLVSFIFGHNQQWKNSETRTAFISADG